LQALPEVSALRLFLDECILLNQDWHLVLTLQLYVMEGKDVDLLLGLDMLSATKLA